MGAFVVIGVLTPIASGFQIDKAEASWVLTSYALVYAFTSPILVAVTGAFDRRRILMIGLAIFLLGALAAALAPSFALLLVARAIMALGGGLITPIAASMAVALVDPTLRGKALAKVFGGLTLAQVLGVPVGAWLGYAFGWQTAFLGVIALSALGPVLVLQFVPVGIATAPTTLKTLVSAFEHPHLIVAVFFTALFMGGLYTIYTFLGPLLEARYSLTRDGITTILLIFGAGAVVGNSIGGFLTDRIGPNTTLIGLCISQIVIMPLLTFPPLPLYPIAGLIAVWSICAWSFMVPQQARLASLDPPKTPVLFALNAAAIYLGGSLGSLVGGKLLSAAGLTFLGLGGASLMMIALASLWLVPWMSSRKSNA